MIKKLLLVVLLGMCSCYTALAQDPFVGAPVLSTTAITTGQTVTATVDVGNASAVSMPQSATYTVNLPPNVGVTGATITVPSGATYAPTDLTLTQGVYSSSSGTIVTVRTTGVTIPGSATYTIALTLLGVSPTVLNANILSNAVATQVGSNVSTNDNGSTRISVSGPQPVSLVSFTARAKDDHIVGLAWTTSLETNNKGFFIERSKDLKAFEKVGEITEVGANSNALKNYTLTDFTPYMGTSYYRLTQVDLDGKATVYQDKVVSVVLRDGAYGVFPNPVINDQQFRLSLDEPETAQINFYGADGRSMPLQKVGVESGNVLLKVTGKLSTGVYILTVGERGQTRKHRLVVE